MPTDRPTDRIDRTVDAFKKFRKQCTARSWLGFINTMIQKISEQGNGNKIAIRLRINVIKKGRRKPFYER